MKAQGDTLRYKVGFLGIPWQRSGPADIARHWTAENMQRLKDLGFNTIQLSVALRKKSRGR
ncbi:MAG: hypothetical protein AABZ39_05095 [Spirochaetota bacterium]